MFYANFGEYNILVNELKSLSFFMIIILSMQAQFERRRISEPRLNLFSAT